MLLNTLKNAETSLKIARKIPEITTKNTMSTVSELSSEKMKLSHKGDLSWKKMLKLAKNTQKAAELNRKQLKEA